jgi:hypothetical protein
MSTDNAKKEGQIIQVTLPLNLVQRLFNHIHPDKVNQFVSDAIEQRLIFEELFTALEETTAEWFVEKKTDTILPEDEFITWLNEDGRYWNQTHQ